jgi:hypothetical protein
MSAGDDERLTMQVSFLEPSCNVLEEEEEARWTVDANPFCLDDDLDDEPVPAPKAREDVPRTTSKGVTVPDAVYIDVGDGATAESTGLVHEGDAKYENFSFLDIGSYCLSKEKDMPLSSCRTCARSMLVGVASAVMSCFGPDDGRSSIADRKQQSISGWDGKLGYVV